MNTNLTELQNKIGYEFNNTGLLKRALRHSSYVNEHALTRSDCNERLEFLGDAVLELISSEFLYNKYKDMEEGGLTRLRSSLVCEPALASDARSIGLNQYLFLGHGEEMTGGRERDSIVSDAMEALIGAVFLDGGLEKAKVFVMSHVLNNIEERCFFSDSKSRLQEVIQRRYAVTPEYRIISETGEAHNKIFTACVSAKGDVLGEGSGRTKKMAEQEASYHALLRLDYGGGV